MTVIVGLVGKKGVLIAGDSQYSDDWNKRMGAQAKTGTLHDTVAYGYCGSGRFGQLLDYHMDSLDPPPLTVDEHRWTVRDFIPFLRDVTEVHGHLHIHHNVETFGPSAFLLGVRRRLFAIYEDFSVDEHVMPYESVGSGAEVAIGSIHSDVGETREPISDTRLERIAEKAISAATNLTLYVGGDISVVKTSVYTADERALAKKILNL